MNDQPMFDVLRSPPDEDREYISHQIFATTPSQSSEKMEHICNANQPHQPQPAADRNPVELFAEAIAEDEVDGDTLLPLALEIHHLTLDSVTAQGLQTLLSTMRDVGNMSQEHVDSCLKAYWKRKTNALSSRMKQICTNSGEK